MLPARSAAGSASLAALQDLPDHPAHDAERRPSRAEAVIHHLGVFASDFAASRAFFVGALAPLGIVVGYETDGVCELWHAERDTPSLSLHAVGSGQATRGLHLAFEARDRGAVDAFHAAALAAGGRERHAPRHWPRYRAYCAFVSDPDGNNVEAVHKEP